jgi:tRNA(fMet)-specific endonuclease VapC
MALLDTTVLIDLGRRPASPNHVRASEVVRRLLSHGHALFTSRINEAEFRVGPELSTDRGRELQRVERILARVAVLEFDAGAALRYAAIKAMLMRAGRPAGDCDILVASVALTNGEVLVTRNPRHFAAIPGLTVESY